ncbi:MAG: oligosaccharide flippase family protein [Pseudomonadota bacterium]
MIDTITKTSIEERTRRAASWSILGSSINVVIRFGTTLVLTRLLSPDDYGLIAIVFAVITILGMLSDIGINTVIVQYQNAINVLFLRVAYLLQILRGLIIWGLASLFAFGVWVFASLGLAKEASVYSAAILPPLLAATALSQIIRGFLHPHFAVFERNLEGSKLFTIEISAGLLGSVVSILYAWFFPSPWAFTAGTIVFVFLFNLFTLLLSPQKGLRPLWDRKIAGKILSTSKWIMLSSVSTALSANSDKLILGGFISGTALGLYSIGAALPIMFRTSVIMPLYQRIAFPAFSEVNRTNPMRVVAEYYRLRFWGDLVLFTLAGGLFVLGPELILFLYDARYAGAGQIAAMMAFMIALMPFEMFLKVFSAKGKFHIEANANSINVIGLLIGLPTAMIYGGFEWAILIIVLHRLPGLLFALYVGYKDGFVDPIREIRLLPLLILGAGIGLCTKWLIWTYLPFLISG